MQDEKQNLDYRQWPNVLAIQDKIEALEAKLELTNDEKSRMALKQSIYSLASQKYDQIQKNKEQAIFELEQKRKRVS